MTETRYERKQDWVYGAIRKDILKGRFPPGSRLPIDAIAHALGVSHIPVREALKQLEAEGYVVIEPYVGTTVARLEPEWIREVFDLMEDLEVRSVRAACARFGEADLSAVAAIVQEMEPLVDDPDGWAVANVRLHLTLSERAELHLTGRLLRQVLDQWDRLRAHFLWTMPPTRLAQAQRDHRDILAALRARDVEAVEALVRRHNREAYHAYAEFLHIP